MDQFGNSQLFILLEYSLICWPPVYKFCFLSQTCTDRDHITLKVWDIETHILSDYTVKKTLFYSSQAFLHFKDSN